MHIDNELAFSDSQSLLAAGDTLSRVVRRDPFYMPGMDRQSVVVQTPVRLMSAGQSRLQIDLFDSIDGQHFRFRSALLEPVAVTTALPRMLVLGMLPAKVHGHVQLRYRVTGSPLVAGQVTAYLTHQPPPFRQVYHASGFTV